jgi:acetyl esterase/lipase
MSVNRRTLFRGGLFGAALASAAAFTRRALAQTPPPEADIPPGKRHDIARWPTPKETIDLWPGGVAPGLLDPGLTEIVVDDSKDPSVYHRSVHGISRPRLCVFPAADPNGAAMIIAPGGGYVREVLDHEGYEMAQWMNSHGITAFVLFYRLPAEGWKSGPDTPLADAQRAMRLVRARAAQYGVDPARVGFMGFSAGGHVCGSIATRYDAQVYDPVDAADSLPARPFLAAPIYAVQSMDTAITHMGSRDNLLGRTPTPEQIALYSPDKNVTRDTPPCFLTHSESDRTVPVENTLHFRAALKAAGVTVETHLFPEGGHGFGLRNVVGQPTHAWGDLFLAFARARGLYS